MTDITPEDVEQAAFPLKMRGYNPEEVDAFLREVADQLRAARAQADKAYQALGEQLGDLLQQAKDRADEMRSAADSDAAKTRAAAEAEAKKLRMEATSEAATIREEAAIAAATMRSDAESDAKRMRDEATADASRMRSDAERNANDMINRAEARVRTIEENEIEIRARLAELTSAIQSVTERVGALAESPVTRTVPEFAGQLTITEPLKGEALEDTVTGEITETTEAVGEVPEPSSP